MCNRFVAPVKCAGASARIGKMVGLLPAVQERTGAVEPTTEPKPLSLKANMLWNSTGSITYLAFQWLLSVVVVRLSDNYDAAGVLALALSVYNIFSPIAVYRMYTYQVSDVNRENTVGEYLTFRAVTTTIALAVCMAYSAATCAPSTLLAIFLFFLTKGLSLLIDVLHGQDQLGGRMDYIGKSLMLQGVGTFAAFCVTFGLTRNLEAAFGAMAAATLLVGLVFDVPRTRRFGAIRWGIAPKKALHLLGYCLPIVIATIACSATVSVPRQMLAWMDGEAALGIYSSVAAPVAIIQMGATYLYNPLLTNISKLYADRDARGLRRLYLTIAAGIALIGVLCAVAFEIVGPWVLELLFGPSISDYTYLLLPVIASAILCAFTWFANDVLVALRCFKGSFIGNVLSAAISAAVAYFCITTWGMNGVSFASIIAFLPSALVMSACFFKLVAKPAPKEDGASPSGSQPS